MLKELQELVTELNTTNSSNEKKVILAKHDSTEVKLLLFYTYDTINKTFGVTSKNLKKRSDLVAVNNFTIIELLDKLNNKELTGHAALAAVNGFIKQNPDYEDLIYNIVDRKLKARIDASMINKVFLDLIPVFNVALAIDFEKAKKFVNFLTQKWFASRKLDGCRCLVIKNIEGTRAYSRKGKEFLTLGNLLNNFNMPDGVYDGEICIVDEFGDEHFQGIMSEIRKKDHTIDKPRFKIFDYITAEEFYSKKSKRTFSERYDHLKSIDQDSNYIDIVEQIIIKNEAHLEEMKEEAAEKGWEGLIIREDLGYEGKRSRHMLKVKAFHDGEFMVLGTYAGTKGMIYDGKEIEMDCMAGINIEYFPDLEDSEQLQGIRGEGYPVDCGSGWSDAEKLRFHTNPQEIIGKIITVQWFEQTVDKKGKISLRFPTKKWIHGDERDT